MCIYTWICHVTLLCISYYTCMLLYIHTWLSIRSNPICYCTYALCIHITCDWPYAVYIYVTHIYVTLHTSLSTHMYYYTFTFPHMHVTLHSLYTYILLYIRVSIHICYSTFTFPYIHVTLHTLYTHICLSAYESFYAYMLLYIHFPIHTCHCTYAPYISVTQHTSRPTYVLLCICRSLSHNSPIEASKCV